MNNQLTERTLFGLIIIVGFFAIGILGIVLPLAEQARQTAKDVLLVVGPLLGTIVTAIWKSDKTDTKNAETVSQLASAVNTAMAMPASEQPQ